MKSLPSDLKKRGMATEEDISFFKNLSIDELLEKLNSREGYIRSSIIINLKSKDNIYSNHKVIDMVLNCLSKEKCLYTKINICEFLQDGDLDVARKMVLFLGKIGDNQYKDLPSCVSKKKSYPLPRDIIARTLSKMNSQILSVLIEVLENGEITQVREVIDAIGFLTFYNKDIDKYKVFLSIKKLFDSNDDIIIWKCITCLSALPFEESFSILERFLKMDNIFSMEANRSLKILNMIQ